VVVAAAVLAVRQQSKQRQQQQHDNNTTINTTTKNTANTEGEYLSGGKEENMCETMFFLVSRYVSTPGQCYASQTSNGTFLGRERYVFMFFCIKIVPVDKALGLGLDLRYNPS
jgi:hypothetical protein